MFLKFKPVGPCNWPVLQRTNQYVLCFELLQRDAKLLAELYKARLESA